MQGNANCVNPSIQWTNLRGLVNPCIVDGNCIEVELIEGAEEHCLTVIIDCEDCDQCPPVYKDICFCDENGICPGCHTCNPDTGICDPICPDKDCCDGICCDCTDDNDCPTGQICVNGTCVCPPGQKKCPDGICKECCDSTDCPPCYECVGGSCVPIVCPTGFCDPSSGDCVECYDGSQCGPNECCINNKCECCTGYYRDENGDCVEEPDCFGEEDCPDPCETCVGGECVPKVCPPGQKCVNGECVEDCCQPGAECPDGYGCINCTCVPCSELSCDNTGQQCAQAIGCGCDENGNCVPIDCDCDTVGYTIQQTPATPGTVITPGLPGLQGSATITSLSVVTGIMNHRFDVSVTGATQGTWTAFVSAGSTGQTIGSGSSASVTLQDLGMPIHPIRILFREQGTGRTGEFFFARSFGSPLSEPNVWVWEFSSQGTPGQSTGGSPGQILVCPTNADFSFSTPVVGSAVEGDINLGFSAGPDGCLVMSISGCGIWEGMIPVRCGGQKVCDIPFTYEQPQDGCCDPITDPNCPPGDGTPCEGITVVPITLAALPYFDPYQGQFEVEADFLGAGLSIEDWFYLNPTQGCWDTTANGAANDIVIQAGTPAYTVTTNITTGGCIRLGYSCELRISGCRKLQGELCLEGCDLFDVEIQENTPGTFYAALSINPPTSASFLWTLTGSGGTGTNQSFTPGAVPYTQVCVQASYTQNLITCSATDCLGQRNDVEGCKDMNACNFDAGATMNNQDLCIFVDPTYECGTFLQTNITKPAGTTVQLKLSGTSTVVSNGDTLAAGIYTLDVFVNGATSPTCTTAQFEVPTCWKCDQGTGTCNPNLSGTYDSQIICQEDCGCNASILSATRGNCNNDGTVNLDLEVTGSLDNTYSVTIVNADDNDIVLYEGNHVGPSITTGNFCPQKITVFLSAPGCGQPSSVTYTPSEVNFNTCCDCSRTASIAVSTIDDDTFGSVTVTITPSACSNLGQYRVRVRDAGGQVGSLGFFSNSSTTPFNVTVNIPGLLQPDTQYTAFLDTTDYCSNLANCIDEWQFTTVGSGECLIQIDGPVANMETGFVAISPSGAPNQIFLQAAITNATEGTFYAFEFFRKTVDVGSGCLPNFPTPLTCQELDEFYPTFVGSDGPFQADSSGIVTGSIIIPVGGDLTNRCYGVKVTDLSNSGCRVCDQDFFVYGDTLLPRSVTLDNCTYNTANDTLTVNWSSMNLNSNTVRIIVQQSTGATADPCVDAVLVDNIYSGQSGTQEFIVPQLNGQATEATVTIFDGANPEGYDPCNPDGAFDNCVTTIPACACDWSIVDIGYSNGELQIELDVECAPNLDDVEIHFDEWTLANCTGVETVDAIAPIIGITQAQADGSLIFQAVPSTVSDRFFRVRIVDASATPGCEDAYCVTIPSCGSLCTSQFVDVVSARYISVTTDGGDVIALSTGGLFTECGVAVSAVNDNIVSVIEGDLNAADSCAAGGITVSWAQTPDAQLSTSCLSMTPAAINSGGSGPFNLTFTGFTVGANPTVNTVINYINFNGAGVPSIPGGVAQTIADFIRDELETQGVYFESVDVKIAAGATTGQLDVIIVGFDTGTAVSIDTNRTDVPAAVNTVGVSNCTPIADGALTNQTAASVAVSPIPCVRITIQGASQQLDFLTQDTGNRSFDNTGC